MTVQYTLCSKKCDHIFDDTCKLK